MLTKQAVSDQAAGALGFCISTSDRRMHLLPSITKEKLLSLKLKELKSLALCIGASSGGTKHVLASRLWSEIHASRPEITAHKRNANRGERSILSIDMGIKNFAYCGITICPDWITSNQLRQASAEVQSRPKLQEWNRLNLTAFGASKNTEQIPEEGGTDLFHPERLAEYASYITKHLILGASSCRGHPDIILIERQRFRTMGSSVVQEWTLRVNMLEAMLWAMLRAEMDRGTWKGEVYSVSPSRVAAWWESHEAVHGTKDIMQPDSKPQKLSTKQRKTLRVERAARCLNGALSVDDPVAQATHNAYIEEMSRPRRQRVQTSSSGGDPIQKLDDLADCLLQAMAWITWQRNRIVMKEQGLDHGLDMLYM